MRDLRELDHYRAWASERAAGLPPEKSADGGIFMVPSATERVKGSTRPVRLRVIVTAGFGWDHLSVSTDWRCPTWEEMEQVKRLFFREDETAMQLHVPPADHINNHPYCLHIWRPHDVEIPRPPSAFVGVKSDGPLTREEAAAVRFNLRERLA